MMAANKEHTSNETKNNDYDKANNGNSIYEFITSARQGIIENFRQVSLDLERRVSKVLLAKSQTDTDPPEKGTYHPENVYRRRSPSTKDDFTKDHPQNRGVETEESYGDPSQQGKEWGVYKGIIRSRSRVISRIMTDRENTPSDLFREVNLQRKSRTLDRTESGAKDEAYFLLAEQELLSVAKVDIRPTLRKSSTNDMREEVVVKINTGSTTGSDKHDDAIARSETESSNKNNVAVSSIKRSLLNYLDDERSQETSPTLSNQTQNSSSVFIPTQLKQEIFNRAATIIQTAVRKYLAKRRIENIEMFQANNVMRHNSVSVDVSDPLCLSGTLIRKKKLFLYQNILQKCGFNQKSQNQSRSFVKEQKMTVKTSIKDKTQKFLNICSTRCEKNSNVPLWDRIIKAFPHSRTAILLPHSNYSRIFHQNKRHLLYGIEVGLSASESPPQRKPIYSLVFRFPYHSDLDLTDHCVRNAMLSRLLVSDNREIIEFVSSIYNRRTAFRSPKRETSDRKLLFNTDINHDVKKSAVFEVLENQIPNDTYELFGSTAAVVQDSFLHFQMETTDGTENDFNERLSNKAFDEPKELFDNEVELQMQLSSVNPNNAMETNSLTFDIWNAYDDDTKSTASLGSDFTDEDMKLCQTADEEQQVEYNENYVTEMREPMTDETDALNTKDASLILPSTKEYAEDEVEFVTMVYEPQFSITMEEDNGFSRNPKLQLKNGIQQPNEWEETSASIKDDSSSNEIEKFKPSVSPEEVKDNVDLGIEITAIDSTVYRELDVVDETLEKTAVIEGGDDHPTSATQDMDDIEPQANVVRKMEEPGLFIPDEKDNVDENEDSFSDYIKARYESEKMIGYEIECVNELQFEDEGVSMIHESQSPLVANRMLGELNGVDILTDNESLDMSSVDSIDDTNESVSWKQNSEVYDEEVSVFTSSSQSLEDQKYEIIVNSSDQVENHDFVFNSVQEYIDYFDEAEPAWPVTEKEKTIEGIRNSDVAATINHDTAKEIDLMKENGRNCEMKRFATENLDTELKSEKVIFCYQENGIEDVSCRDESPFSLRTTEQVNGFEYVSQCSKRYEEDGENSHSYPLSDITDDNGTCFGKTTTEIQDVKNFIDFAEVISSMKEVGEDTARLKMDSTFQMLDAENYIGDVLGSQSSETDENADRGSLNKHQEPEDLEIGKNFAQSPMEDDDRQICELEKSKSPMTAFIDNCVNVTKGTQIKTPVGIIMHGDFSVNDEMESATPENIIRNNGSDIKKSVKDIQPFEKTVNVLKHTFSTELDKMNKLKHLSSDLPDDVVSVGELEQSESIFFGLGNLERDKKRTHRMALDGQNANELLESTTMLSDGDELSNNLISRFTKHPFKRLHSKCIIARNDNNIKWQNLLNNPSHAGYKVLANLTVPSVFDENVEVYSSDEGFIFNDYVLLIIFILGLAFLFSLCFLVRVKFESLSLEIS